MPCLKKCCWSQWKRGKDGWWKVGLGDLLLLCLLWTELNTMFWGFGAVLEHFVFTQFVCVCVRACVRACVCACVPVCVRACVWVCVRARACMHVCVCELACVCSVCMHSKVKCISYSHPVQIEWVFCHHGMQMYVFLLTSCNLRCIYCNIDFWVKLRQLLTVDDFGLW